LTIAVAQKAVVANTLKTVGQNVEQEAANELLGLQGHRFLLVVVTIIFPAEDDLAVVDVEEAVVGKGDAMGIATQVVEDLFRAAEGCFGVDDPLGFAKRGQVLGESLRFTKSLESREELELAAVKGDLQGSEKEASEEARQHADGQEEARTAGDPTLAIRTEAPTRHHTMQVGMMKQVLSPGVKHGEKADFRAQVLRIRGEGT